MSFMKNAGILIWNLAYVEGEQMFVLNMSFLNLSKAEIVRSDLHLFKTRARPGYRSLQDFGGTSMIVYLICFNQRDLVSESSEKIEKSVEKTKQTNQQEWAAKWDAKKDEKIKREENKQVEKPLLYRLQERNLSSVEQGWNVLNFFSIMNDIRNIVASHRPTRFWLALKYTLLNLHPY